MLELSYWYMFPVGLIIATLATSSGVGGALFFSPIFILLLKLEPSIAIGTAIFTEVFGVGSGIIGYAREHFIDYNLGRGVLLFTIPMAILGSIITPLLNAKFLQVLLGLIIVSIGFKLFFRSNNKNKLPTENIELRKYMPFSILGGFFLGSLSVGLGELLDYAFMEKCFMSIKKTVATSVFVVGVTAIFASATHFFGGIINESIITPQLLSLVMFTVPGVVIGGQVGPRMVNFISPDNLKKGLSVVLIVLGILSLLFA